MMKAGMEILQEEVVAEASKHKDTGAMAESIKPTGLMAGYGGGYYMCTRPTGRDKKMCIRDRGRYPGNGSGYDRPGGKELCRRCGLCENQ